jgi:hypothetical protein
MPASRFRPGDVVVLRTPAEIIVTLDATGALDAVPFMPEMAQYFGRRMTVSKRVEKICDTVCPVASRRMRDAVFLDDVRCDGGGHGGCEAACRIYWKDAWLAPAETGNGAAVGPRELASLLERVRGGTRQSSGAAEYRCQATMARAATQPMRRWDVRQYVRELSSGNVRFGAWLKVMARVVVWEAAFRAHLMQPSLRSLAKPGRSKPVPLGLLAGEWVEVRSREEIAATLDAGGTNRGLYFSAPEMVVACGKQFRVRRRVRHIVDERTGKMLDLKNDCIELEGIVCDGDRSVGRWFCAREIYPYWREAWLKRVAQEPTSVERPLPGVAQPQRTDAMVARTGGFHGHVSGVTPG